MTSKPTSTESRKKRSSSSALDPIKELTDLKRALDASAIVAITDQTGRITYVNDKFCEISKFSRAELLGEDHRIINSGFHSKEFIRNIWTTIAGGRVWHGELRNRAKDGSYYWVDTTIVPFLDDRGKPFQYIAIRYDITERKLGEDRIRQQASLLDKAQDAIMVCDLNYQLLYWNKGAERMYGWTAVEVFGRPVGETLPSGQENDVEKAREALLTADETKLECQHSTSRGDTITVESRWTLVRNDAGEPDYFLITNTDITGQKRTEEHLMRAQRMESIGTLAGGIAHDLNNILSPILLSVDMLELGESESQNGDTGRWLRMIRENAERGADLVRQVLTFARGMTGERISVRLKHLVKELVGVLNETLPKSIRVRYDIAPDLWPVSADPTQINQMLVNICINARDAMPAGGTITIEAQNLIIDENYARMNVEAVPGSFVLLAISDTGIGMTPDVLTRIFDPFFTTKEIGKGTGLGLAITLTIIKSHGGFINVYSEPGKGTRFSVYIPAATTPDEVRARVAGDTLPRGNGELILVVDDEENIRKIAQATLEHFGYHTLTASDGNEAVAAYTSNARKIALVLTDVAMPSMDGTQFIGVLRDLAPNLPVIAMSGLVTEEQSEDLKALNVDGFLAKPYTATDLLNTISRALAKDRDH